MTQQEPIRWAPKVRQDKIRRLYENDARRIVDEELIDDVGYALYVRCRSILEVTDAVHGRAKCHGCGTLIAHGSAPEEVLRCPDCGWTVTWADYQRSYREKQLFGGAATPLFRDFTERFLHADSAKEKMRLIDRLIHEFHWNLIRGHEEPIPCRPTAANLIEANKLREVVAFLDTLTYGESRERAL